MSDEDLWRLNALGAAFASRVLQTMLREWNDQARDFYNAVSYLRQVQTYYGDPKPNFGVTSSEQWQKVEGLRQDLTNRVQAIGDRVQQELEGGR